MLTNLKPLPADKILMLMQEYAADPRDTKVDLGVGVYKNAQGHTPIMRSIKAAEQKVWEEQTSKSYVGLAGDPAYSARSPVTVWPLSVPPVVLVLCVRLLSCCKWQTLTAACSCRTRHGRTT